MSYGTPEWQPWVLGEEEGIAQIKFACVFLQIQGPEKKPRVSWCPSPHKRGILLNIFLLTRFSDSIRFSYENGIQTFDTANVSP